MTYISETLTGVTLATSATDWGSNVFGHGLGPAKSCLLLLIDASRSMGDAIGGGNLHVKIEAARRAAVAALGSTIIGTAKHFDDSAGVQNGASDECRRRGGASCIIRAWACTRR